MNMLIAIVDSEESREIAVTRDAEGRCIDSKPVEGSERAFLDLELQGGAIVRAEVSWKDFDAHIAPTFAAQGNVST
jgi:hypothetical protein